VTTFELLGSTLGLSYLAGMRLYATVLAVGLGVRFNLIHLPQAMSGLGVLSHPAVLITAGVACVAEFVSDKIPWFDSIWDGIHTFIRPVGAGLLGAAALSNSMDPAARTVLSILCGGVALTSHSTKAATRAVVNTSPEPFSNIGMSLLGDVAVPAGIWVALNHPILMFVLVLIGVAAAVVLARWIIQKLRSVLARVGLTQRASTA
jgi:hypothetical protein